MPARILPVLAFACLLFSSTSADDKVRFNEHVRPLLSDRCFACHGPDERKREARLRLDKREGAVDSDTPAIIPGKPDESEFWRRITSTDPHEQMPPPASKKPPFTASELDVLKRWILQGAEYEGHWAFLPLRNEAPPDPQGHPIDAFIRARLAAEGLTPSPEADRATLLRRVTLDLVGLLPTLEEVDAFLKDTDPQAYEKQVDRLLASPHYGERWGRHWLDQARYADSNGYSIDAPREMWPYRDWVIQALNQDLPFDQFTIEQLAGDLLPNPSKSQLVATGFHRNTLINQEGGTDREQFRVEATMDRVATTGAVWLGLTVGCAQCHTHKFDPITHRDYYRLFAFFNSAQDANDRGPVVEVRRGEMFGKPVPIETDPSILTPAELATLRSQWEAKSREVLTKAAEDPDTPPVTWAPVKVLEVQTESGTELTRLEDGSLLANSKCAPHDRFTVTLSTDLPRVAALRLRVLTHDSLPKNGPGLAGNGNFVLSTVTLSVEGEPQPFSKGFADHEQPNFPIEAVFDSDPKTGWAINVGPGSTAKMNADHEAVLVLSQPLEPKGRSLTVTMSHDVNAHYLVGRFAFEVSSAAPTSLGSNDAALLAALVKPTRDRTAAEKSLLQTAFEKAEPRAKVQKAVKKPDPDVAQVMVLRDLPQPRETFLLTRGDFTRPNKDLGVLTPGVPEAVSPLLPSGGSRLTRLDLARWLVHPDNPLTPRVTVNRIWMRYFGRGLVETDEDFGSQGTSPTHPALLDWLARDFQRRGWSQKTLHRLIVTSATYRQSSRLRTDLLEKDPRNLLLARQERIRMEAEITRDAALAASGLLDRTIGGPSIHPPQPEGVYAFTQVNKAWPVDLGSQRYRRGLYVFFYRSAPYPLFTTFDAPDFQSVCTRRLRSNTPLQALTLANDRAFLELAQGLARRLVTERPGDFDKTLDERIRLATLLCFSRPPTHTERDVLRSFVETEVASFRKDPAAAAALAGPGMKDALPAPEGAALVLLGRVLFNADNFITRE